MTPMAEVPIRGPMPTFGLLMAMTVRFQQRPAKRMGDIGCLPEISIALMVARRIPN